MAKGVAADVLDNGLNHIRTACTRLAAVIAHTPGDSYAAVVAAPNVVAAADITSADFSLSNGAGGARVLTSASKVTVAAAAGNPTHLIFLDVAGAAVLAWTDETGAVVGTPGGSLRIPSITLTSNQST